jgi:adenylosuccinate lyase
VALVEEAGLSREEAYSIVQRNAIRAADERAQLHRLLATDPEVAGRLTLARLDACFDDAAFLRHVPAVVARLDAIDPARRAGQPVPEAAR